MAVKSVQDFLKGSTSNVAGSFNQIQNPFIPQQQTLQDLREDEKFATTAERFLSSLGKGKTPDELFSYFRGADFNLYDATKSYIDSRSFSEQQKQDYLYLRNKFDNADIGGLKERLSVTKDIAGEMLSDPTFAASVLLIPWTGGLSLAGRMASAKATQAGLKKLAGQQITKNLNQVGTKIPFQKLKSPLTKKQTGAILATEGFTYGSIDEYMRQGVEIETDQRAFRDTGAVLRAGAITGAGATGLYGLGLAASRLPKFQRALQDRRIDRIDNNDNYKADLVDKGSEFLDKTTDFTAKLFGLFTKPTSRFIGRMKKSKTLEELVKIFRYDADKRFVASELGKQERLVYSFNEELQDLLGDYNEELFDIINPLKTRGTFQVPAIGSRDAFFKLPFGQRAKTKLTKEKKALNPITLALSKQDSIFDLGSPKKIQRLDPEVNDDLFYYLNTEKTTKIVDGKEVPLNKQIVQAGKKLRGLLDKVRNKAQREGVDIYRRDNYFPRKYIVAELQDELINPGTLTEEIMRTQNVSQSKALELIQDMIDNRTFVGASIMDVAIDTDSITRLPGLSKERFFSDIDDVKISKYLDTDIETVLADYIHQSTALIARKKYFGINVNEFKERYIDKIQAELGAGNRLNTKEIENLINMYKVTTGQQDPIKTAWLRAALDGVTVVNQMALLPFATITSLSEIAVPILKGAGKKTIQKGKGEAEVGAGGIRTMFQTVKDYGKFWWNDIVQAEADVRSKSLRELNRLNRAMTTAGQDRALAMFGQGITQKATQAQNVFFKNNLLHDWTRFVQLTSYEVGKSKIYENLYSLANNKNPLTQRKLTNTVKLRLQDELNELGVNIEAGIKWVKDGANPRGIFYKKNFTKSAARYVDEVVMNPTAASNQKPLLHSYLLSRALFGLMGFPTAFSNTVLKNGIRDITRDVRQFSRGRFTTPGIARVASGVIAMTAIGAFGNIIRTGGKELDKLEEGEITLEEFIGNASRRTGLWGPLEQYARIEDNRRYRTLPDSVLRNLAGPVIGDIIDVVDRSGRTSLQIAVSKIPGVTVLRQTNPEAYKDLMQWARENDFSQPTFEPEEDEDKPIRPRPPFQLGGLVDEYQYYSQLSEEMPQAIEETKKFLSDRVERGIESSKKVLEGARKGDYREAFEAYETLPIEQQIAGYIPPVTNFPLSLTGAAVYTEKAKPRMKTVGEYLKGVNPTSPVPNLPFTVEDPLSAGIAVAEGLGAIPLIGAVPKLTAKGLKTIRARRGDDTMGGGGNLVPDIKVKVDEAGFTSNIEEVAVSNVKQFSNAEAFVNFLQSPKRQFKKQELEFIDLNKLQITEDTTPNDVIQYIQENKPQLSRVVRTESPTLTGEKDNVQDYLSLDEPMTRQYLNEDIEYAARAEIDMRDAGNEAYRGATDEEIIEAITKSREQEGYEYLTGNIEGTDFALLGNQVEGYQATIGVGDNRIFLTDDFVPKDEALVKLNAYLTERGLLTKNIKINPAEKIRGQEGVPDTLFTGEDTLPTEYSDLSSFRLSAGGSDEYREIQLYLENPKEIDYNPEFVKSIRAHYPDTKGVNELLHYRVSNRIDTDGKKVLYVDEIQSDVHQLGEEYGYISDVDKPGIVPDFPYKDLAWVEVAVKDAIQLAIKDGGFDRISFADPLTQLIRNNKKSNYINNFEISRSQNRFTLKVDGVDKYELFNPENPLKLKSQDELFNTPPDFLDGYSLATKIDTVDQMIRELGFDGPLKKLINDSTDNAGALLDTPMAISLRDNPEDFYLQFIKDNNITELDDIFNRLNNVIDSPDNTLVIDVNRLALGEGKKFIDIYGNLIPKALKKIGREQYNIEPKTNKILLDETDVTVSSDEVYKAFEQKAKQLSRMDIIDDDTVEMAQKINNKFVEPKKLKTISLDISPKMKKPLKLFARGGLVVGEDNVPFTKEDPADRVDPFTGSPYKSQMEELGL
tara:strand:- start:213 stop:6035 length:5823 start_codon:yes stop_codon:yes gene_type:complete